MSHEHGVKAGDAPEAGEWADENQQQLTRLAAGGQGEGIDDGHENAAGASSGGGHGGRQARLCNAQAVGQAQRALAAGRHKEICHALPQPSLLEALHAAQHDSGMAKLV